MPNQIFANGQYLYGPELNSVVQDCTTIAALRDFIGNTSDGTTLFIEVGGGTTVGDGLGGLFIWYAQSTETDNGTTIIQPNGVTGAGRWQMRQESGNSISIDNNTIRVNGSSELYAPGGSGGSQVLWQPGVPELSSFTQRDIGTTGTEINATFIENPTIAIAVSIPASSNGHFGALTLAAPTPPYEIALALAYVTSALIPSVSPPPSTASVGWFDGTAEYQICSFTGDDFELWDFPSNYSQTGTVNDVVSYPAPQQTATQWLHLRDDGTNVSWGISADGAVPQTLFTIEKIDGFLANYADIAIAFGPTTNNDSSGGGASGAGTLDIFVYDPSGLTRLPGPPAWPTWP